MLPDLSSANWKIDRALELLNGLDAEVIAWHGTNPAGFAVYVNPEFTRLSVTVKVKNPPPTTKWSLVYADIVHNLRCALDHTVWALLQNEFPSGIPLNVERLSFPIWDSPPTANQRRNFQPVSSKLFAAIESVQPYNQPFTQFPIHPLAIIRDIDNGNKHRLLFSLVHSIARFHVPITNVRHPQGNSHSSDIYRGELTDDVEIMAITFDIPEPYMKYDGIEFVSIIAVRHPTANLSGKDRDDYAALTDTLVVWVRKTIGDLVAAAV